MPSINDRIGSQNVIRVLSNASSPPTRLINLSDVDSTLASRDGMILVWDLDTETFYMTDTIDSSTLVATGIVSFTNTTQSTSVTTGALVVNGGLGIGKNVNIGENFSVTGLSTFLSNVDIDANVDILYSLTVNSTFKSVGVTTLASSGGITTTGGDFYAGGSAFINTNLRVGGTSEFIGNATFRGGTIGIGDSTSDDINVGGEFVSDLVPNDDDTYDLGIIEKRWKDGRFSGLLTATNLYISDTVTFDGSIDLNSDIDINGNLNVTGLSTFNGNVNVVGFVSVTEGLYYDLGDYDGPNGIAYFDNTGKLIGAASTENALTESYFVLTTNAVGIPTWTSVIDGGVF
jgi:hypothetical protein